jgi:acetate kinase
MAILALNCGSSSVKFGLFRLDRGAIPRHRPGHDGHRLADGLVDRILTGDTVARIRIGEQVEETRVPLEGQAAAVRHVLTRLMPEGRAGLPSIDAVGHRVVHGGTRFRDPVLIDEEVAVAIEGLEDLAPLHNRPSLAGIRTARAVLGPGMPMVAVFDTAFHASLPEHASRYAIDRELATRHDIRRFGFHGISYQSVLTRYCEMTRTPAEAATLVAFHLGNGCSAAAIKNGHSADTSMGFTPLEGLVMGTRSGDLDPAIVEYLSRREGVPVRTVGKWLTSESGLLGLSGLSSDVRTLLGREGDHAGARLALAVFCYRARKYLGAYLAALGGARAVVFTGGIGEHAPEIRARICAGMDWCGLSLDPARNAAVGVEGCISPPDAALKAYVIATDEEQIIARETASCVEARRNPSTAKGA